MTHHTMYRSCRRAFSLVELSIVLVILGLLVGGILSGQALIRAAELRSIATEYNRYVTATQTFRDKYFSLPGDMPNAQSFWGIADATPATCKTTASTGTATCNGNGNGRIQESAAGSNEIFRYWQHLANAGLIEGQFDGITHGSNDYSNTAASTPRGRVASNSLWFVFNWGVALSGDAMWFDGDYGNRLALGGVTTNAESGAAILRPEEMWNIDTKIDDGKPGMGRVMTRWNVACNDATSAAASSTASYALNITTVACAPVFPRAF